MTINRPTRTTIIGRAGLLGATAGIVLGLIEASNLRLVVLPMALPEPRVPNSFWFIAPLLTSITFALIGLATGCIVSVLKSRFLGMVALASLAGGIGYYFGLMVKAYPASPVWFIFLRDIVPPCLIFALVFGSALATLWSTRKANSPLGVLADIPMQPWSLVVISTMVILAASLGVSQMPDRLRGSRANAAVKSQRPNIVVIVWDTTRADHLSSYGYSRNTTPNVDQLAKSGVLFENAISASSWTLPATASMFTSLLPHQHAAGADIALGNGPRTMAEVLSIGGYETVGFNANPYFGVQRWGLARGFETYIDSSTTLGYSLDASHVGHDLIEPFSEDWFQHSRFNQFTAGQLNEEIYRWFNRRSDRPFFLFLNYNDAHDNYEVPAPYDHYYGHVSEEVKSLIPDIKYGRVQPRADQREQLITAYDNALRYMDSQVGELLRFLQRSPEWSNTYVIFTADHGEAFGEHHNYTHGWDLNREVLHVPLVVAGPGVPAGVRISDIAGTRKIFGTVLDWAGVKGTVLRRSSLSRMWNAPYLPTTLDEPTLSEMVDPTPVRDRMGLISITTREWHFIFRPADHGSRLYHWPTDPLEQQDVSELPENQATVEHLKASLFSLIDRSYRPWRDTRFLQALVGSTFSLEAEAAKPNSSLLGGPRLPLGPGAAQSLFRPNPETPQLEKRDPDKELLKSLPYEAP